MGSLAFRSLAGALTLLVAASATAQTGDHFAPPWRGVCLADGFPTQHDRVLRQAWNRHAGAEHVDRVCRFIAQIRRESSARADAESGAGAVGIGQQVGAAAQDCRERGGLRGSRRDVRFSAGCAAWLMKRHMRGQREKRTALCKHRNAELAYVSGPGHVWKGQRLARNKLGLIALCAEDGILAGMELILHDEAYHEAMMYVRTIDKLERRAVPGG